MRARYSRKEESFKGSKTSIKTVAIVLGVYTALYLAIVGGIQFITASPDAAAAIAPEVKAARAAPAPGPLDRFRAAGGLPPSMQAPEPGIEETDNSRECTTAVEAECIYN